MAIKYRFVEGEGYTIKTNEEHLKNCHLCGCGIENDEIFYLCEKSEKSYCDKCRLHAPCHRPNVTVIPTVAALKPLCIHKKILSKEWIK